jgi:hypothetical protein
MKLRYRFPVFGYLRLDLARPLREDTREVAFELDKDNVVRHVSVTIPAPADALPRIQTNPEAGIKLHLDLSPLDACDEEVATFIRTLEGLLAIWGVERIDTKSFELQWVPENDQESRLLQLTGFKMSRTPPTPLDFPVIDFAYAAQSAMSADILKEYEVALSFNRQGKISLAQERFIDAVYEFYFVFETLFANGQFKTASVKDEFRASVLLQKAIASVLADTDFEVHVVNQFGLQTPYASTYKNRHTNDVSDHFVELRGFLHHHSVKRPGIWHPARQHDYRLDAEFMAHVSLSVIQALAFPTVLSQETIERTRKAVLRRP